MAFAFRVDIDFTNNDDTIIYNGHLIKVIGTTLDVINFSGVGVRQTSNKEDELIVLRVGVLIVCVN